MLHHDMRVQGLLLCCCCTKVVRVTHLLKRCVVVAVAHLGVTDSGADLHKLVERELCGVVLLVSSG